MMMRALTKLSFITTFKRDRALRRGDVESGWWICGYMSTEGTWDIILPAIVSSNRKYGENAESIISPVADICNVFHKVIITVYV